MKRAAAKSLPVAMYHYVNDNPGAITLSPALFEEQCRVMAERGWRGVSLAEAEDFFLKREPLPEKSVLLSFDDGYLDNCCHALPALHAHGHKAVLFAVSNRLEEGEEPRFPLPELLARRVRVPQEVSRPIRNNALGFRIRTDIFCNRAEARAMEASGVISVAAHSQGHYGVFTGPDYSSFAAPGNQQRTFYRTETGYFWGMPNFKVGPGLLHRAFLPDPELLDALRRRVPQNDEDALRFFADDGNVRALKATAAAFAAAPGRFESDGERRERMWREIAGGKTALEALLGHEVISLCWPWGKYCPEAETLAREAGFRVLFTTAEGVNPPGEPLAVHRFKAKAKSGGWLVSRLNMYSRPLLGRAYARVRNLF